VSLVVRDGQARAPRGSFVFEPGDEVYVLSTPETAERLRRILAELAGDRR
jgi:Trk K+ transport system NAD-binding subunit